MRPKQRTPGHLRIGCSGYIYRSWRGDFYPRDLSTTRWFEHYAAHFDTVEINNTFYRLPESSVFASWCERAPPGFIYAVKLSRFATHMKKLKDPEGWLERFLDRAAHLGPALGPVLAQLPPGWKPSPQRLNDFLSIAPRTIRWAVEMREREWLRDDVYEILRRHNAALCIHDLLRPHPVVLTADWTYLRFHGPHAGRKYTGTYTSRSLRGHASRIRSWIEQGIDVFAYFNNDAGGHAPWDAMRLRRYVLGTGERVTRRARRSPRGRPRAAAPGAARSPPAPPAR